MKMWIFYSEVLLLFYIKIVNSAFFFPSNSAYGIFAALAVPLDLGPHRNVFVSYNFEANYNLPVNWQLPSYLEFGDTRRMKQQMIIENEKDLIEKNVELNKLESRDIDLKVKVYDNSTKQKTIVLETSDAVNTTESIPREEKEENEKDTPREKRSLLSRRTFYSMLIQRFKMPSSSKDEQLSDVYYRAEFDGQKENCEKYWKKCPDNFLDLITTPRKVDTTVSTITNT